MQFQLFVKLLAAILVQSWPLSEATFSDAEKKKILDTHNQLRQSASPSAAAMNFITWKKKLEHLALKAAEKCKYEHSYGGEYAGLGENIYKGKKTDPELIIFGWFSEKNNYKHDTRTCTAGRMCGHYTAVVFDIVVEVGCAIKKYCTPDYHLVFCEYSHGSGGALYKYGPPCSACPSTRPFCIDGLCANTADPQVKAAVKEFDSTASSTCRLACKNCGKQDTSASQCKCKCDVTVALGPLCESCYEDPACLNNGVEDTSDLSVCKCNCKSGFTGSRCEIPVAVHDNSVKIVLAAANQFKFISNLVFLPVARSLFNLKLWPLLQDEFAAAINAFCRKDATSYAACCPGKTFPSSSLASVSHVTKTDIKFVDSTVANSFDNSLSLLVYSLVSSSDLCKAGTCGSSSCTDPTEVAQTALSSALKSSKEDISKKTKACCGDVILRDIIWYRRFQWYRWFHWYQ
uniref:SCP domain-containing protein n=1 Tax=Macrostomum lignano TaxID=282301 RepID=A0A1I8HYU9_9PLAT